MFMEIFGSLFADKLQEVSKKQYVHTCRSNATTFVPVGNPYETKGKWNFLRSVGNHKSLENVIF